MSKKAIWLSAILLASCTNQSSHLPDGGLPLEITSVEPQTILPGSVLRIFGSGFVKPEQGLIMVRLDGPGLEKLISPQRMSDEELRISIDKNTFLAMGGAGRFMGRLVVLRNTPALGDQEAWLSVTWTLVEVLQPLLESFSPATSGVVYLGDLARASGTGFLLGQPAEDGTPQGEGFTELRFAGTFTPDGGASSACQSALVLQPASFGRDRLEGMFPVEVLGLEPGEFAGDITVVNRFPGQVELAGNTLAGVRITLGPTALVRIEPLEASRGQRVYLNGRGFVAGSAITAVRVEGQFVRRGGGIDDLHGENALFLFPQVLSGEAMELVLRVAPDGHGGLTGLGLLAGELQGTATPVVFWESRQQAGIALSGQLSFRVLPQKQVVFLKYLPGFSDALREFGLRNLELEIRQRIMQVVDANYRERGINVEFVETRPTEYVDYGVVEIGGVDPNGRDLLGLDATMTELGVKDMGNVYFDDVVGGWNAESAEQGHLAYGGVFLSSYLAFSPKHPKKMPIADPLFDEVFEPFMPSRGGKEVSAGEYPGGPREAEISRAIHALGSMIGDTVAHEWGHTLGLAYGWGPPDVFHTLTPGPNQLMDAGNERPFAERAQLNGQGPATWTQEDYQYLREILPRN